MIALGNKDFGGSVDLDILKIADAAVLRLDIAVAPDPLTKNIVTGAQHQRQGDQKPDNFYFSR